MSKNTETAVVPVSRRENLPAPVSTMQDIEGIGKMFERSGMFGCTQEGQGTVLAMTCVMQKMTPLEFIQTYHIVEGRPSMRADAMLAKLLEIGGEYKIIERSPEKASVFMRYRSAEGTFTLTHEDVKAEPFYWKKDGKTPKDNYATPRKRMQMLWARVASDGVRAVAPVVVSGLYTPEEIGDFSDEPRAIKTVTQAPMTATVQAEAKEAAVTAEVLPPENAAPAASPPTVDFKVCPMKMGGKDAGTPFNDFDTATLSKFLGYVEKHKPAGIEEGHTQYVRAILAVRAKEGGAK